VKRSLPRAIFFAGAFVLAGACIALDGAAAVEITIELDDTRIELVAPKGYCSLERSDWPRSQLVDFTSEGIKNQGERLAYLVDCERAGSWHEGGSSKDAGDVVDYQASPQLKGQDVTDAMVEELCATLHKHDDSSKGWFEILLETIKGAVRGSYEDTTVTYLVFGYEDPACHVLRFTIQNREKVYTVSALTTIKSKLVTVHVSTKVRSMDVLKGDAGEMIKRLLATSREAARALVAANQ
jgi:hypothetical protein